MADKYGRKKFILMNNAFFIAGGLCEGFAQSSWMMIIGDGVEV